MQSVFAANTQASQRVIAARATSDEVLLESIADGGKAAMHVFYARHNVRIYKFILRIVGNATVAEDVVSQVFLDVWRTASEFEGRSQVSTWLHAIARFKALNALNRRRHEDIEQNNVREIAEEADTPEMLLDRNQTNVILRNCVAQLSPVHREIIDLFYYHEKSVEEVGEMIGIPQSTVKTRMFYARKQLVDLLMDAGVASAVTKHSEGCSLRMITIIKCKCGAEYNRTDTKFLITQKGNASCEVCGSTLESWDSTHVPSFELIKRPDREPDRALDGRGETFPTMWH